MAQPPGFFETFNPQAIVPLALKKFDIDLKRRQLDMVEQEHTLKMEEAGRQLAAKREWEDFMKGRPSTNYTGLGPEEAGGGGLVPGAPGTETKLEPPSPQEIYQKVMGMAKPGEILKLLAEKPETAGSAAWGTYNKATGEPIFLKPEVEKPVDETKGMTPSQKLRKRIADIEESGTMGPPEEAEIEGINRELAKIEGIAPAKEPTPPKVQSMGNAVDLAINTRFQDPTYLTDPEKQKEALVWLGTPEGKKAVADAAATLTVPNVTYLQTTEGFVPATTRGPGAGTIGSPVGLAKPISSEAAGKIGELNTLLSNIKSAEELYKPDWVGPVAGRVGAFQEKFTGTASENQVKFYAYVRDMQDALLRARSGAQINEQEYQRLKNFLPDELSPSKTFETRLKRFHDAVNTMLTEKKKALSEAGYGIKKPEGKVEVEERKVIGGKNYIKKNGKWYEE